MRTHTPAIQYDIWTISHSAIPNAVHVPGPRPWEIVFLATTTKSGPGDIAATILTIIRGRRDVSMVGR
jgi:hypothetical protein